MIRTFLTGAIPLGLFLYGLVFHTTILVVSIMIAGLIFASYLIGDSIREEFGDFKNDRNIS